MAEYSVIGKSLPRIEGPAKATGDTKFSGDFSLPRQLWGRILASPHAHARLLNVDTKLAEKLAGVRAVITGKDALRKWGYTPEMVDQYPLALEKVRYIGEAVAAVAAVDEDTAQEALGLIRVEYEPLPAVFDFIEAMKPGAPLVHEVERNIAKTMREHFGNVDEAFTGAFYERTDVFVTQGLVNGTMEPHSAMASLGNEGHMTLWSSTQAPFKLRRYVAEALGIEESLLRVIKPAVGGGFCGKSVMFPTDYCTSLLSLRTGRPVRLALNREEVFYHGGGRMPMVIEMRMGVDRDGRFVAIDYKLTAENGAYNRNSLTPMVLAGSLMHLPYRLPNSRYEGNLVYTNNPPTGVQRGAGNPQIRFAVETQMDMIAEEIGLDPMEMRLRNSLQPGDFTPNRLNIRSCALRECIKQACASHGWDDGRSRHAEARGKGLACGDHSVSGRGGAHDASQAVVKLDHTGTATVLTGSADIGQGSDTTMSQIAAEVLGLNLGDMRIVAADTETTPLDLGTFGSRVTVVAGNAVKLAATDARSQVFAAVADRLEARIEDMEARGGRVYVKGAPDKGFSFADAVNEAVIRGKPVLGRGLYDPPTEKRDPVLGGNSSPNYSFGAQVAEVVVDPETGLVDILSVTVAQDVGFALNPMGVSGQLDGSVATGLGQARWEDLVRRDGAILNPSFLDYKMPTALDMPPVFNIMVEEPDPEGPFGAKGMAEGGLTPSAPAATNALYHATGVRLLQLPMAPEVVLEALGKVNGAGG